MAHEERAYKLLGLIPADFAYLEGLVALYTAQIGGYYDPEQRYYAMAAWLPQALQLPIAIHELTHALQDQHYHLAELMDEDRSDTDTLLARLALAEGDATAVMIDYSRQLRGQTALAKEKSVSGLVMQNVTGAMLTSSMTKAPSTLQALVVFPYLSGLNFVHQLLRHGGYRAVDRAFKRPPISTEEILHPQQYLRARNSYRKLDPLPLQTQDQARLGEAVLTDTLGEFFISTLLSSLIPTNQAAQAAAGWAGDRLALYLPADRPLGVLTWALVWDSAADAQEFYLSMAKFYEKRLEMAPEVIDSRMLWRNSPVGNVVLSLAGTEASLTIGFP